MVKLIVANAGEESAKAQAKINCLRREQNKGSQLQGDRLEKLYTNLTDTNKVKLLAHQESIPSVVRCTLNPLKYTSSKCFSIFSPTTLYLHTVLYWTCVRLTL